MVVCRAMVLLFGARMRKVGTARRNWALSSLAFIVVTTGGLEINTSSDGETMFRR